MADEQRRTASGGRGGRGKDRGGDKAAGQRRPLFRRRKVCKFCMDKIDYIDYKDVRILPRRISGVCAPHQRKLQTAIKRARQLALIPYVAD
jgi:small subunit ribosomal protein S18